MPPLLDCLRSSRAAKWIGFERYKDTGRKMNGGLIDKGQWIVVRGDLPHLKSTGFSNLSKYSTLTNEC